MPSFTVYQIGQPDRQVSFDKAEILLGREAACDVSLPEVLVSRRHALVRGQGGRWTIEPLAEKNPTVVNGEVIREPVQLADGDELQLGCFLVVFSVRSEADTARQEVVSYHAKCAACKKWEGTVAVLKSQPVCPECGSARLIHGEKVVVPPPRKEEPRAAPKKAQLEAATKCLTPDDVLAYQERVKRASMAQLVRGSARFKLLSERPTLLGKAGKGTDVPLDGFLCGFGKVEVAWKGTAFFVTNGLLLVGMKVNGEPQKEARLKTGDTIVLGPNSFTFEVSED